MPGCRARPADHTNAGPIRWLDSPDLATRGPAGFAEFLPDQPGEVSEALAVGDEPGL